MHTANRLISTAILLAAVALPLAAAATSDSPAPIRRKIPIDPATDYIIGKYSKALDNDLAAKVRNFDLAEVLAQACAGVHLNMTALKVYVRLPSPKPSAKEIGEAKFLAGDNLRGLDITDLEHLCPAVAYLFGAAGVLVPDILTPGDGRLAGHPDANNPYFVIPR